MLLLNPSPTRFATNFLRIIHILQLKDALRVTVHFQYFIALKWSKEEITVATIKDDQSFHQRNILIKMAKSLLVLLKVANSNQPHMYKFRFIVLTFCFNIKGSLLKLLCTLARLYEGNPLQPL